MLKQAISRVLFPETITRLGTMIIHLVSRLPARSSDLPGNSGGPPSNVPLFGLAPDGVCIASDVTAEPVSSYLTLSPLPPCNQSHMKAVSFLLHFPSRHRDWALPSILSFGARTFLSPAFCGAAIICPASTYIRLYPHHSFSGWPL